ncbi:MAG: hypothetical protein LBR11_08070 [Deltaproteobacteria bacterium]|nr:hypothetical protein [Deltaproteobacteria bacterium]
MLFFFRFLAAMTLPPLGLLSLLVGLAYQGQAGANVALGTGAVLTFLGAWALLAFLRWLYPGLVKKRANAPGR